MKPMLAYLWMTENAAQQKEGVDYLILGVHVLMFALFIGWFSYFVYVLFRYSKNRNPRADYKGVTNHASTYVEGIVAVIEGGLLLGLALPIWASTVDRFPDAKNSTVIHVVGQQFQWNAWYAGTNGVFARADAKFVTPENAFGFDKSDPNYLNNFTVVKDIVVPVGKPVIAYVTSRDVIHSFAIRPMRSTQDAIPGMVIPMHFTPAKIGTYMINCAQLCGAGHYGMRGNLVVVSQADYDKWAADKIKAVAKAAGMSQKTAL